MKRITINASTQYDIVIGHGAGNGILTMTQAKMDGQILKRGFCAVALLKYSLIRKGLTAFLPRPAPKTFIYKILRP